MVHRYIIIESKFYTLLYQQPASQCAFMKIEFKLKKKNLITYQVQRRYIKRIL